MRPVAIVRHQGSVPPGHIAEVLDEQGLDHFVVAASEDPAWPEVSEIGALIVLGGTMNVDQLDEYPFLKSSRDLMADAIDKGVPTLGVCLGSQMMARVLGAEVRRADPRNAFFSQLELTPAGRADALMVPFDGVEVLQFHEDTFAVPEEATALATSARSGLAQAFRYGEHAYAVQFHFEVDPPIVEGWLDAIGASRMCDEWGCPDGGASLTEADRHTAQAEAGRELVRRFLVLAEGRA